jgi:hypothetical protein
MIIDNLMGLNVHMNEFISLNAQGGNPVNDSALLGLLDAFARKPAPFYPRSTVDVGDP